MVSGIQTIVIFDCHGMEAVILGINIKLVNASIHFSLIQITQVSHNLSGNFELLVMQLLYYTNNFQSILFHWKIETTMLQFAMELEHSLFRVICKSWKRTLCLATFETPMVDKRGVSWLYLYEEVSSHCTEKTLWRSQTKKSTIRAWWCTYIIVPGIVPGWRVINRWHGSVANGLETRYWWGLQNSK